jgi:hypothetical protein
MKADMCDATAGAVLIIDGLPNLYAENSFSNAECFTSLDGVSFALDTATFTPLNLINGWQDDPQTAGASVKNIGGVIQFAGAINTSGTSSKPFVLPAPFRPATYVFVPVNTCHVVSGSNAGTGRLVIAPGGTVIVQAGSFADAACSTDLEGVSFLP